MACLLRPSEAGSPIRHEDPVFTVRMFSSEVMAGLEDDMPKKVRLARMIANFIF